MIMIMIQMHLNHNWDPEKQQSNDTQELDFHIDLPVSVLSAVEGTDRLPTHAPLLLR